MIKLSEEKNISKLWHVDSTQVLFWRYKNVRRLVSVLYHILCFKGMCQYDNFGEVYAGALSGSLPSCKLK